MKRIERRAFLKLVGLSGSLAAAATLPSASALLLRSRSSVAIRAEAGMPAKPMPSMATHVLEGWVDTKSGTGTLTSSIFAGHPGATSDLALPGLTRLIRITEVQTVGDQLQIAGVVSDRSQLMPAESPAVSIVIDRVAGTATARLRGNDVTLRLVPANW
ncbi:MAG TPA: hypothetical protein VGU71_21895 [Candidatus Dormibacteraeota bacterium]|nr:hypothetical protein [Candidatus Dormibacteraeota bacterium]